MHAIEWLSTNRRFGGATVWQWLAICLTGCLMGATVLSGAVIQPSYYPLLLIMVMAPFAVMIVGDIKKLLIVIIILEIPIQLDQSFFYNDLAADLSANGGFNVSVSTLCIAALYILWLAEALTSRGIVSVNVAKMSVRLGALYAAIVGASMLYAPDFMLALFGFNIVGQSFLLFTYIALRVRTEDEVRLVAQTIAVTLLIQALIMLLVAVIGHSFYVGSIFFRIDNGMRVGGTMGGSNSSANTLVLLAPLAFSLLITKMKPLWRFIGLAAFCAGLLALLLTFSRGGWMGFTAAMFIFYVGAFKMRWVSLKLPILMFFVVIGIGLFGGEAIVARLTGDDGDAAAGRVPLMYIAAYIIRDNILLGVGTNNFSEVWDPYLTPEFSRVWLRLVHNKYLLVWSETGSIGIIAYLSFLLSILRNAGRAILANAVELTSPLALGMFAGICGAMVHMNVEILNNRPQEQMLWLICGLVVATYNVQSSSRAQEQTVQYPFIG